MVAEARQVGEKGRGEWGNLRAAVRAVNLLLVLLQDALAVELLRRGGETLIPH